jgi:hypothetical protein
MCTKSIIHLYNCLTAQDRARRDRSRSEASRCNKLGKDTGRQGGNEGEECADDAVVRIGVDEHGRGAHGAGLLGAMHGQRLLDSSDAAHHRPHLPRHLKRSGYCWACTAEQHASLMRCVTLGRRAPTGREVL